MQPYRFVFTVECESEEALEEYIEVWRKGSECIQREPGARGTRLHRINPTTVLAIAEWESLEARDAGIANANKKYPENPPNEDFGTVTILGEGYQVAFVPPGQPVDQVE